MPSSRYRYEDLISQPMGIDNAFLVHNWETFWYPMLCTTAVLEVRGDEILKCWDSKMWWIFGGKFPVIFFQETKEHNYCHRKLHHLLHCKKRTLSPGTHSGSILAKPMLVLRGILFSHNEGDKPQPCSGSKSSAPMGSGVISSTGLGPGLEGNGQAASHQLSNISP